MHGARFTRRPERRGAERSEGLGRKGRLEPRLFRARHGRRRSRGTRAGDRSGLSRQPRLPAARRRRRGRRLCRAAKRGRPSNYDVLAVTPPNGSEIDLWVDPQTHLIARERPRARQYRDRRRSFRTIGASTASRIRSTSATQTSTGNSSTSAFIARAQHGRSRAHARAGRSVHDFSIAGGASTTVPLQIVNNHVYVSVMLDGRGPYTFVLDSGGDYIVTPEVAAELRQKSVGGSAPVGRRQRNRRRRLHARRLDRRRQGAGPQPIRARVADRNGIRRGRGHAHRRNARLPVPEPLRHDDRLRELEDHARDARRRAGDAAGAAAIPFFFDGTIPRIPVARRRRSDDGGSRYRKPRRR